ncbi:hypothetical protein MKW98_031754 [Papaver atlanticum]|uniref:CASP-like protein n=1 Tax=Papaver atlanticum TaxID=357466 RepID=A0AAD4S5N7_9MAGN|nr:hypothetical protein MKW98_031754 [Papaver atlanticum]
MAEVTEKKEITEPVETESRAYGTATTSAKTLKYFLLGIILRGLLFAFTLTSVILMITAKQTEYVRSPLTRMAELRPAKWSYSPAFIFFVSALWMVCGYSVSSMLNTLVCRKKCATNKFLIQTVLADVLVFGILASATGTAGGVAYIGLKGNSHIGWFKICNIYDKFCRHIAASLVLSLVALVILLIIITLSTIQTRC